MRRALLVVSCIGFVVLTPHLLFAQYCDKLASRSGKEAFLSYLENYPKHDLGQECVAFAIKGLADDRNDQRAARVLIRYLDYYWKEPGCEGILGGRCMGRPYPATNSLMEIGDISRPYVLQAIESDSISQLARENAVDVYYYFIRDDTAEGVAALKWEADTTNEPKAKEHLLWAASALAKKWCFPFEKGLHKCEEALTGRLPFNVAQNTYAVFESVIRKEPHPWPFEEYAISKRTVASTRNSSDKRIRECINALSKDDPVYESALADFLQRNRASQPLALKMRPLDKPYVLLDDTKVTAYREKLRRSRGIAHADLVPDRRFGVSGPLISVSRVGFGKNGAIALVYVQHECASSCSGGGIHVLRRHANFWLEEAKRDCEW
jgi:hypothetical protein